MSFLSKVGEFLFGKDPDIFDDKGAVLHKLPKKKWDDWHNRLVKGSEYNWRSHVGVSGQVASPETLKDNSAKTN